MVQLEQVKMSNIVVDTSVLIAVITNEPSKEQLIEITQGFNLIAPQSVHWEIGNAFSAMLKRKRITLNDSLQAIKIYWTIPMRLVEVEIEDTIELADAFNIYAYDAYLLRCALKYNAPLLTLDKGLENVARRANIVVMEVSQ